MRWECQCVNCDHQWEVELDEFEDPDSTDERCPECGSDLIDSMLLR